METGDRVPDLKFATGPGEWKCLSDWGFGPLLLIFLRHLA